MSDTCQHGPGSIVSPQSPGERKKTSPNPNATKNLQPQEQFSRHYPNEDLGTHYWALHRTPPIFAANGILFVRLGGSNRKLPCSVLFIRGSLPSLAFGLPWFLEENSNSKRFILTCTHNCVQAQSLWWARLDSNQRCFKSHGFTARYPRRQVTDPYITHLFDASYKRSATRKLRKLIKGYQMPCSVYV